MATSMVEWKALRGYCQKLLMQVGLAEQQSFQVADNLVDADLSGISSHGVARMANYMKRISTGVVSSKFEMEILHERAAMLKVDAHNSMGVPVGAATMERCIEKAKEAGVCFASVTNSNHYGTASYYIKMATREGMLGYSSTNAAKSIAPWGGSKPFFGTNPVAIGVPTKTMPMVLDMATSVVAKGKLVLASKNKKPIPEGWALDKDGNPTVDPDQGLLGSLVPIGGPKGYGLSMFVDVLCGVLGNGLYGIHLSDMFTDFEHPSRVGHVFGVINIRDFVDYDVFIDRLEAMIAEIKSAPKRQGVEELFVPGEIEWRHSEQGKKDGIPLTDVVAGELKDLGSQYAVAWPF